MRVDWSPEAVDNVEEIAKYIARDNPAAARKWIDDVFELVVPLGDFPNSGRVVPEIGAPRIRELLFKSYRIIYRIGTKVEILTVRHTRQSVSTRDLDEQ